MRGQKGQRIQGGFPTMAIINGTEGADTIRTAAAGGSQNGLPDATDTGDTINGLGGDDIITGGAGDDVIDGGNGNDTIRGGNGNDTLRTGATINGNENLYGEDGDDTLVAGTNANAFFVDLFGGAGNDTIRVLGTTETDSRSHAAYSDRTLGIVADLVGQTVTIDLGGGMVETDTLINVRGVRGGDGNDTFIGSVRNEVFLPGLGNNVVQGGDGIDSVRYYELAAGVVVDLQAGTATHLADGSTDSLTGIEQIVSSNFDDSLFGTNGDNDFRPLAGNDLVDGRGGYDVVNYGASAGSFAVTDGVTVNLTTGLAIDPWGNSDTLTSIEMAIGTNLADDLTGVVIANGDRSQLRGLAGDDTLRATVADTIIAADYRQDPAAVRVNLSTSDATLGGQVVAAGTARDGFGGTDTLVMIQSVRGSNSADFILGSARNDLLEGEGGNDTIEGGAGNDRLRGNNGNDTLIGGEGDDTLRGGAGVDTYSGGAGYDSIEFNDGTPTQGVVASLTTGLITDQFGNAESIGAMNDVEYLIGGSLADDLEGKAISGNIAQLNGGGGNDTLRAGSGSSASVVATYHFDADANNDGIGIIADLTLASGQVQDTLGGTDTLLGVGGLRGSQYDDLMLGNAADNWFRGEGGDDLIDGAGGFDILSYTNSFNAPISGIEAELSNGAGVIDDGLGGFDFVSGIEQINGSRLADSITISGSQGMTLFGNGGDDVLTGGDGDDFIDGGLGLDTGSGGGGNDTIVVSDGTLSEIYSGGTGQDRFLIGATLNTDYASVVADIVTDFEGGDAGDWVDLANVVSILVSTGEITAEQDPFATGNLRLASGSAVLQVDWDGTNGAGNFTDLLVLQGTTPAQLTAANFGGYDPNPTAEPTGTLVNGLGGTAGFGEGVLPIGDDSAFAAVDVTGLFGGLLDFHGTPISTIYVNNNGYLTFDTSHSDYDSDFASVPWPVIAGLWTDLDTRGGPTTASPGGNSTGSNQAYYDLDTANQTFTATWDDVGYYNRGTNPVNAFQIQLVGRGGGDFDIVYRYEAVGPGVATVGFANSDDSVVESLPGSGTTTVDALETLVGNTGLPGVWVFEVRGPEGTEPTYSFTQGLDGAPPANQAPPPATAQEIADFVREGSATLDGTTYHLVENIGAWNAIKNVALDDFDTAFSTAYAFANFVSVEADFSSAGTADLDLLVSGAKRSDITTADGDDTVTLLLHSNGWGGNANLLATMGGNDTVLVQGVGNSTLDNELLADNAGPGNGRAWNAGYTGGFDQTVTVDAGAGNDLVQVQGSFAARLFGGSGDDQLEGGGRADVIDGGAGADSMFGGAGRDTFVLREGEAEGDLIIDFTAGDRVRLVGFDPGTELTNLGGGIYQVGTETFTVSGATGLVAGVDYIFA